MTPEDIRQTAFDVVRKGYRPEDVDDYLLLIASEMERMQAERDAAVNERAAMAAEIGAIQAERDQAVAAKDDAENKMYILAGKVEEYRGQEDTLKTALINAQRMGETVVKEAKQKADQMLREATGQSELIRQSSEEETERERKTLENLLGEVSRFKSTILNLYKQHIESLSALDAPVQRAEDALQDVPVRQQDNSEQEEAEAEAAEEMDRADDGVEEVEEEVPLQVFGTAEPELPAQDELLQIENDPKIISAAPLFEGSLIDEQ